MTIETLKKHYPDTFFVELNNAPSVNGFFELKNLDDFFKLSQKVGFEIIETDAEETQDSALNFCVDAFYKTLTVYYDKKTFLDYLYDYISQNKNCTLKKLFPLHQYTKLTLYSLESNILYSADEPPYPSENFIAGTNEIEKIYNEFENSLKEKQENKKLEIKNYILSYKQQYEQLESKSKKDDLIKQIQFELHENFNLDYRSDPISSKIGIKNLLEN